MNNNSDKIMKIADFVDLNEAASAVASAIDKVSSRDKLHVALVGGQNSGKTTIINAIAGKEIREASSISLEDELPLRITFERTDEDVRFECVEVYDRDWNEENAVIFEFKSSDIIRSGKPTELSDEVDVIFYLISAMNAFTAEDVLTIKALSNHNIKLVVTKLDAIDEENREGVIKYITNLRTKLGLSEPLIIDRSNLADAGKMIRNALPLYAEQKEHKEKYCDALLSGLKDAVKAKIGEKLSGLDEKLPADENSDSQRETYSKALAAKSELIELGAARSKRFENKNELTDTLTERMLESGSKSSFSEAWQMSIKQDIIEPMIAVEFDFENDIIRKQAYDDAIGINPTEEEAIRLKNKISDILRTSAQIYDVTDCNAELVSGQASINFTTVGITAAVVAGALLIPMPTLASWIVSIGAIAVGTGAVIAEKKAAENAMWNKNIRDYSAVVAAQFYNGMKIYSNEVYEKLADYVYETIIKEGSDSLEHQRKAVDSEKEKYRKMLAELE